MSLSTPSTFPLYDYNLVHYMILPMISELNLEWHKNRLDSSFFSAHKHKSQYSIVNQNLEELRYIRRYWSQLKVKQKINYLNTLAYFNQFLSRCTEKELRYVTEHHLLITFSCNALPVYHKSSLSIPNKQWWIQFTRGDTGNSLYVLARCKNQPTSGNNPNNNNNLNNNNNNNNINFNNNNNNNSNNNYFVHIYVISTTQLLSSLRYISYSTTLHDGVDFTLFNLLQNYIGYPVKHRVQLLETLRFLKDFSNHCSLSDVKQIMKYKYAIVRTSHLLFATTLPNFSSSFARYNSLLNIELTNHIPAEEWTIEWGWLDTGRAVWGNAIRIYTHLLFMDKRGTLLTNLFSSDSYYSSVVDAKNNFRHLFATSFPK